MRTPISIVAGTLLLTALGMQSVAQAQTSLVTAKFKPSSFEKTTNASFVLTNKVSYETADETLVPRARIALAAAVRRLQEQNNASEWTVDYGQSSDELKFSLAQGQVKATWKKAFQACAGRWLAEQSIDTRSDFIMLTAAEAASDNAKLASISALLASYISSKPGCIQGTEDLRPAGDAIVGRTALYLDNRVHDFPLPSRIAHLAGLYDEALEKVKIQVQADIQNQSLAAAKQWLDRLAGLGLPEGSDLARTRKLLAENAKVSVTRFVALGLTDLLGEEGVQKAFESLQAGQVEDPGLQNAAAVLDSLVASCAGNGNSSQLSGQVCNDEFFDKLAWLILNRSGKSSHFLLKP